MNPSWIRLRSETAATKFKHADFTAFEVAPPSHVSVRGGLILIQEIFGVNSHIRSLAQRYANEGFMTCAPAYFDHIEPNVEFDYDARAFVRGRALAGELGWEQALEDTRIVASHLRATLPANAQKIAVVGFCWGGSLAWLAACRLEPGLLDAAVCYYGRATHEFRHETARAPALLHFGEKDSLIPMENVREFQAAQPSVPVHVYAAGHGFNCDQRQDFDASAAALAHSRTMEFLRENGFGK